MLSEPYNKFFQREQQLFSLYAFSQIVGDAVFERPRLPLFVVGGHRLCG